MIKVIYKPYIYKTSPGIRESNIFKSIELLILGKEDKNLEDIGKIPTLLDIFRPFSVYFGNFFLSTSLCDVSSTETFPLTNVPDKLFNLYIIQNLNLEIILRC